MLLPVITMVDIGRGEQRRLNFHWAALQLPSRMVMVMLIFGLSSLTHVILFGVTSGNDEVDDAPSLHGQGALEKDVIPTNQIENLMANSAAVDIVSLKAAQASVETLKQMYVWYCNGTDVDPPKWWMYHYECPMHPFLTKDAYSIIGNMSRSENGVFVPRMQIENITWYGQMLDFYVAELFFLHPKPLLHGRFLEIGAYTGLEFTNTLFFEHYLQWEGWLFEPTTCYDLCRKNRPAATTKVFQQGLCPNATEFEFQAFGNACKSRVTKCIPLTDMDEDWNLGFDFISIDVEGNELDVLKSIDFHKVPVKVLVIEWRTKDGDSRADYLAQFGFVRLANLVIYQETRSDEVYYRPDLIQPHIFKSIV